MGNPGDRVKVVADETYEGILLPRPEILDPKVVVIKLDSGYNIGIDSERIKEIVVIEEHAQKEPEQANIPFNEKLPTIALLSFGGTIASRIDYQTGGVVANYTANDYIRMVPELTSIANFTAKNVLPIMSEDLSPDHWKQMAQEVYDALQDADGVIITQGTDTMHYSSAALTYMLRDIGKPVIFTGAQKSIDRGSSDGFMNLLCSARAAASGKTGVYVCMHGTTNDDYCLLIPGTKVRKMHTSRRDAFRPINTSRFWKVYPDTPFEADKEEAETRLHGDFAPVGFIKTYPGMSMDIVDFHIQKGVKGLCIEATGLGNIPKGLVEKLEDLDVPIVICSQTIYGRVHPYVYTNLRELSLKLGCIFAEDMPPETAYVKLSWALGTDAPNVKTLMQTPIWFDISDRSSLGFLQ